MKVLHWSRVLFTAAAERRFVRDVKEKPCCICSDLDTEHKSTAGMDKEKTYEHPDENIITVHAKLFRCVEGLSTTLPSMSSWMRVVDFRKNLYANVGS